MPSEDYAAGGRGPLKLKGAKITKHKKKSKKDKEKTNPGNLEKALSITATITTTDGDDAQLDPRRTKEVAEEAGEGSQSPRDDAEEDTKTETEKRFAEAKRKKLKELTESGRVRPELLKTHKQRVEDLNSHLSRLSEHHDMPKIGPG
ncbi:hypothetical protein B0H67DRAFT_574909 [Lasiosphaeris hirsuta]|uniref:DUF1754-domain-containing protein n=1 Tax=Lasiosphaeris hirsuta TaxID=260670 RepID=A0AA40AQB2_9PEZI|nr:hypothetical protein B0H67DRAFT_574909 [Lasiosphaeris hirsuta]